MNVPTNGFIPRQGGSSVSDAVLDGRQRGHAPPTSPVIDLLLTDLGMPFDRWVVLNALATASVPAELGLLVPALSAALEATDGVRFGP